MCQVDVRMAKATESRELAGVVNSAYRPQNGEGGWTHESGLVSGQRVEIDQVEKAINNSIVLVGVHKSAIVACVQIQRKGTEAYIGMLAVEPTLQRSGVGKCMLSAAESYAAARGATEFKMLVISARTELIEFYRRRGYGETGEIVAYPHNAGAGVPMVEGLGVVTLRKLL